MRPKQQKKKNNNKNWIIGYQVRNQGDRYCSECRKKIVQTEPVYAYLIVTSQNYYCYKVLMYLAIVTIETTHWKIVNV